MLLLQERFAVLHCCDAVTSVCLVLPVLCCVPCCVSGQLTMPRSRAHRACEQQICQPLQDSIFCRYSLLLPLLSVNAQQNDAMNQAAKVHAAMDTLIKENEALTLQAALGNTFKVGM